MTAPTRQPVAREIFDRFRAYHQLPGNAAWGSLHAVLEDGNWRNSSVAFCIEQATLTRDEEGKFLAEQLLTMSITQRIKIAALC